MPIILLAFAAIRWRRARPPFRPHWPIAAPPPATCLHFQPPCTGITVRAQHRIPHRIQHSRHRAGIAGISLTAFRRYSRPLSPAFARRAFQAEFRRASASASFSFRPPAAAPPGAIRSGFALFRFARPGFAHRSTCWSGPFIVRYRHWPGLIMLAAIGQFVSLLFGIILYGPLIAPPAHRAAIRHGRSGPGSGTASHRAPGHRRRASVRGPAARAGRRIGSGASGRHPGAFPPGTPVRATTGPVRRAAAGTGTGHHRIGLATQLRSPSFATGRLPPGIAPRHRLVRALASRPARTGTPFRFQFPPLLFNYHAPHSLGPGAAHASGSGQVGFAARQPFRHRHALAPAAPAPAAGINNIIQFTRQRLHSGYQRLLRH